MQSKKHPSADLERKKGSFLRIGYTIALLLVLIVLEWKCRYSVYDEWMNEPDQDTIIDEYPPVIIERKAPQPVLPVKTPSPAILPNPAIVITTTPWADDDKTFIPSSEISPDSAMVFMPKFKEEEDSSLIPFWWAEEKPKFGNGDADIFQYFSKNVHYPQMAREANISGKVHIYFVVDKTGKVKDAIVKKGIGGGCDEEALRAVRAMPLWSPGKQRGRPVAVSFTLPVNFDLK